jgi:hypothetical protein
MNTCAGCQRPGCDEILNLGELPVSHHYPEEDEQESLFPVELGQCRSCGLVQLLHPLSPVQLMPRFNWITYKEPEHHLDSLVETLIHLPALTPGSVVAGLSYNDDSTLDRLRERGFTRLWRPDMARDLDIREPNAGIEMVQAQIQSAAAIELSRNQGPADLLLARMILEHTPSPADFLKTARELVKNDSGFLVVEVPDCSRAFDWLDYTVVWESHPLYFTPWTFQSTLRGNGFAIEQLICYPAPYENCLVAIARPATSENVSLTTDEETRLDSDRAARFAATFPERRASVRRQLEEWRIAGKLALFGAGHHSAMFLNLMGVADLIEFVVDDHPQKCGRLMPGSRLPIVASSNLMNGGIKFCLSGLGVESEAKVVKKHEPFIDQGGVFASIFAGSPQNPFRLLTRSVEPSAGNSAMS